VSTGARDAGGRRSSWLRTAGFQLFRQSSFRPAAGALRCALAVLCLTLIVILPLAPLGSSFANESVASFDYAAATVRTPNPAALDTIQRSMLGADAATPLPATMSAALADRRDTIVPEVPQLSETDRQCLATAIYFEARGESQQGQAGVAQVVVNRTQSGTYPATVCGVVYQNRDRRNACQFSFACDGKPDKVLEPAAWATAKRIADEVAGGRALSAQLVTATHYHASYVSPRWARKMKRLTKIGQHIFYYEKGRMLWSG
jgi:spore germination cell wall hydrolase CwlJ-like protein